MQKKPICTFGYSSFQGYLLLHLFTTSNTAAVFRLLHRHPILSPCLPTTAVYAPPTASSVFLSQLRDNLVFPESA